MACGYFTRGVPSHPARDSRLIDEFDLELLRPPGRGQTAVAFCYREGWLGLTVGGTKRQGPRSSSVIAKVAGTIQGVQKALPVTPEESRGQQVLRCPGLVVR